VRPRICWSDLPGRRVGIYGLGTEGHASLRACRALGIDPLLVDDNPDAAGDPDTPVVPTSDGGLAALARCEVVIKAPGIGRYGSVVAGLIDGGVTVVGGLGLWLAEADPHRVMVITCT
jgi:UDP-N-acetylmuramoylalanine--D-glutamate ligase